jgi:hypothetical protein
VGYFLLAEFSNAFFQNVLQRRLVAASWTSLAYSRPRWSRILRNEMIETMAVNWVDRFLAVRIDTPPPLAKNRFDK